MEEEFYATIKLTSGEELVAKVCYLTEEDSLLLENPMLVERVSQKKSGKTVEGFLLKEWICSSYETMFVVKMETVITMSELDKKIEGYYMSRVSDENDEYSIDVSPKKLTKQMGYLGSVAETKKLLEDLFNKS